MSVSANKETIIDFRNKMSELVISRYKMNPESIIVVAKWNDWDFLWRSGYRCSNAGEAFNEWLSCT